MIAPLLPSAVVAVEAFSDVPDEPVFPGEEALVARAVESRRREFVTGRRCAREALSRLGFAPVPLLSGPRREPLWPGGVVGAITHCTGYRAAAVARASDVRAVGIDAEPDGPLPRGVLDRITAGEDLSGLPPGTHWDKILFSAKESVYKAWFPLTGRWLGFEDATVTLHPGTDPGPDSDPGTGTFTATILIDAPAYLSTVSGRYRSAGGLVLTAATVPVGEGR